MGLIVVSSRFGGEANLLCDECSALLLSDGTHKPFVDGTDEELFHSPRPIATIRASAVDRGWREDAAAAKTWLCPDCAKTEQDARATK